MPNPPLIAVGTLIANGVRYERAGYHIEVTRVGDSHLSAEGVLTMSRPDRPAMAAIMTSGRAELELAGGLVVEIVPTAMSGFSDTPQFKFAVSGPIPGYAH